MILKEYSECQKGFRMRLDKFLSEMNLGSRSQIKDYIDTVDLPLNALILKKNGYLSYLDINLDT